MNATTHALTVDHTPATAADAAARERDASLVDGLLARQPRAWRELERRHGAMILRCIQRVIGRFRAVASADDVQEVHASLVCQLLANDMQKLRAFDPSRGHTLGGWLSMLATNAAWDHLRSVRRDANRATVTELESLSSSEPDPYERCEQRQRAALVARLAEDFSDKDREFLGLYFGEGLEAEEVATRMGISVKTVYSKKHKIRSRLESLVAA
jgi:RNA polymerase sigma-70 factor (ECF subfamily)